MDAAGTSDEHFIDLLTSLNLLDYDGNVYKVHDWEEHNAWAFGAKERSKKARAAAKKRWADQKQGGAKKS